MTPLEFVGAAVTAVGVWLLARRSLLCWPVNIAGVMIYAWFFFTVKLYSDMLLQIFYLGSGIYGWIQWKQGEDAEHTVAVQKPSLREMAIGIVAAIAGALALGSTMRHYTDAAAPWMDSTLTCFSLLAQIWSARRFIENWWLWIALDVFYIGLFGYKHLYPTLALYAVMMGLCFYGLADWRKAARA